MNFLWEHSLSIVLVLGYALCSAIAYQFEPGQYWYDFWLMNAGGFGGSALIVVLAGKLWEKGSDPSTPPEC